MASTGATDADEIKAARAANRFDIRRIIGGLFVLYSLILIALGLFGSRTSSTRRPGSTSICGPAWPCSSSAC